MADLRLRVRKGDLEIEIQGPSADVKTWFDALAAKLGLDRADVSSIAGGARSAGEGSSAPAADHIATQIKTGTLWESIYDRILRQRPALPCELLCLYFAPNQWLAAGEISKILQRLGRKSVPPQVTRDLIYRQTGRKHVHHKQAGGKYLFQINALGRDFLENILRSDK
jgi:hypothetical protein